MIVWGITDGTAGTVAQVKALAAAIGAEPLMKKILIKKPYVQLPNRFYPAPVHRLLPHLIDWKESDPLMLPWPDVIISCGRRAALSALAIREWMRATGEKKPRLIHIQDPQMPAHYFDLVIPMAHDKIVAPNVIKTRFALHTISPEKLDAARSAFAAQFASYPKPHIAVLLGGSTNKYTLTPQHMDGVIQSLHSVLAKNEGSLLITASRRTGEDNAASLAEAFKANSRVYLYDGQGENPYMGLLACADFIIATNDSVNMMSEAVATGKPLYILPLPGHSGTKPARFAESLIIEDMARPLWGKLERFDYPKSDEMQRVADEVRRLLAA